MENNINIESADNEIQIVVQGRGDNGLSSYQIWLNEGNEGTEADFLQSLKGEAGADGEIGPEGPAGIGEDGDSAYHIWLDLGNEGTEQQFIDSLKGTDGENGTNGDSHINMYDVSTELPAEAEEGDIGYVRAVGIVQPNPIPTYLTGASNQYTNLFFNGRPAEMPETYAYADILSTTGNLLFTYQAGTIENTGYSIIAISQPVDEITNIQTLYAYTEVEQIIDGYTHYAGWTKITIDYTTDEQTNTKSSYEELPDYTGNWYIDDTSIVGLAELGKYFKTTSYISENEDMGLYVYSNNEWTIVSSGGTGTGTVESVNGVSPTNGNVVLTSDNITEGNTNLYLTSDERTAIANSYKLEEMTEAEYLAITPETDTMYIVDCPIHVTYVELDSASEVIVQEETWQLTASVYPLNAEDKTVTWSSSDESYATVDENGLVTAVGEGVATITVTTNDGGYTDTCIFTVSSNLPKLWQGTRTPISILDNRVTINTTSASTIAFGYSDNTTNLQQPSGTWFTMNAGDKVKYRAVYVSGTKTAADNTSNFILNLHPYTLGATKLKWVSMPTNAGEYIEYEYTAPAGNPTVVSGLYGGTYSTSSFTNYKFDIELYYKASGEADYTRWI